MNKKIVFVSVPMNGKGDTLIERHIQVTKAKYLKETGLNIKEVVFVDNFHSCREMDFSGMKKPALGYLSNAIRMLGLCDEAVFGTGWTRARGCMIEMLICMMYGIGILNLEKEKISKGGNENENV